MRKTCYLCGERINAGGTRDHVPPLQFFAPPIRRAFNLDSLLTLPAHRACNSAFAKDEEYFAGALAPLATGSATADALNDYNAQKFRAGDGVGLRKKILDSFDARPSGLYLPDNKVLLRLEGDRIRRVAWKIVRGLFFLQNQSVLPEQTVFALDLREPENHDPSPLDGLWEIVKAQESRGVYGGIFDYKYASASNEGVEVHAWGMLLWDRIMVFVGHGAPGA